MVKVKPKKHLGQHFLKEPEIAKKIVKSLTNDAKYSIALEIGPGTGILTNYLLQRNDFKVHAVEVDKASVDYLTNQLPDLRETLYEDDFLKKDWRKTLIAPFGVIGNFPYNISSQIFFKILEMKDIVPEVVCMLQKEVAYRILSKPGSKAYGILSVLLQAFYITELIMNVSPRAFIPPPKVDSAVIRLRRNNVTQLACDEVLFFRVVKQAFQNRRKTLRNALKPINLPADINMLPILDLRAEQLAVDQFVSLTSTIEKNW